MMPSVSGLTPASSDEILRPVNPGFIALTLFFGLVANVVPSTPSVSLMRPDFLARAAQINLDRELLDTMDIVGGRG